MNKRELEIRMFNHEQRINILEKTVQNLIIEISDKLNYDLKTQITTEKEYKEELQKYIDDFIRKD